MEWMMRSLRSKSLIVGWKEFKFNRENKRKEKEKNWNLNRKKLKKGKKIYLKMEYIIYIFGKVKKC